MPSLYYTPTSCGAASFIAAHKAGLPLKCEEVNLGTHQTASGADFYAISPKVRLVKTLCGTLVGLRCLPYSCSPGQRAHSRPGRRDCPRRGRGCAAVDRRPGASLGGVPKEGACFLLACPLQSWSRSAPRWVVQCCCGARSANACEFGVWQLFQNVPLLKRSSEPQQRPGPGAQDERPLRGAGCAELRRL